jgi:N-acetylglucosaminyl-diphospho-decaprenol L-rhamnosyltransferase
MNAVTRTGAVILNYRDNAAALRLAAVFRDSGCVSVTAIVDNSETGGLEGSEPPIDGGSVIFLRCPNDGYARGNNRGLRELDAAHGAFDYFIVSNTDVEVTAEAVKACVDYLDSHPSCAVAAPRMMRPDGTPHHLSAWRERTFLCDLAYSSGILSRTVGMYRETYPAEYFAEEVSSVDCVSGSFFVVRAGPFRQMGYFDEHTFLFYEEDILGFRLKRMGLTEALLNRYSFIHREGVSAGRRVNYLKKYLIMQRSRLYFHRVYLRTGPLRYFVLCLATALGTVENALKTVYYNLRAPSPRRQGR